MKIVLFSCLFICHYAVGQIEKVRPGNLKPGFISLTRFDTSRPAVEEQAAGDKGRIIQVNVWYPSTGDTKQVSFADYIRLVGKELNSSLADKYADTKGADKYFEWPASAGANKKTFMDFLDKKTPMQAWQNAKWLKQKSPVVMLVHGFAADYAYLAEYLAGNGYTVLQVPVKGTTAYELDYERKGLESQVKDYEYALRVIEKELSVATGKIAVVGFSFGGQSAVALSLRNKNIKAIVSLDGGIGSAFGAELLSKQRYYDACTIKASILHLYNPDDTYTDLAWFDKITGADRFLAAMKNMQHGHFTSFGLLNKTIPGIIGKTTDDPGNGYEAIMLLTKEFLDRAFKNELTGRKDFFEIQKATHPWIKNCIPDTEIKIAGS